MAVNSTVLFDRPQSEVASLLRAKISQCKEASLVVGFATVEGVEAIADPIRINPSKLRSFVVGAATYRAFDALDRLAGYGVPVRNFFVHLGHTRQTGSTARYPFLRYHPMLHSKIYYLEMANDSACAFIGSHNLTGFALSGLNGEASVMLEGDRSAAQFRAIRDHLDESRNQAVAYDPSMKEAYSWWTSQFLEGLTTKANDIPRDGDTKRTIVVLAEANVGDCPVDGDKIYFEIPEGLDKLSTLNSEVHVHLFASLPPSPADALLNLSSSFASLWCRVIGIEDDQGGAELEADWEIGSRTGPILGRVANPFRPRPPSGMQQVRIEVQGKVFDSFEYLFDVTKKKWEPIFDNEQVIQAKEDERRTMQRLKLVPREDWEWLRVKGLQTSEPGLSAAYKEALIQSSPQSGSFVLLSLRRRKR